VDADIFSQELSHRELQELAQAARWDELAEVCRQMKYWLRVAEMPSSGFPWAAELGPTVHLMAWADAQAARYGRKAGGPPRAAVSSAARDPLNEHLGRESYNVLGEFEAAMETGSYREAAQTVCNMSASQGLGLVTDLKDPQLLVSLPITIGRRMAEVPELREAMRKHFGTLGQLRRREAIAADDPAAIEAITLQFPGTEAAAAAHAWLGDRELSMGRVAQAASHYREALPDLLPAYRAEALARLRLAEALMGHDVGQPVTAPVNLGELQMGAAEFERLVGGLREARTRLRGTANIEHEGLAATTACPAPGRYEGKPWARITCREDAMPAGLERYDRRFTAAIGGDQMIVTDQIQQTALDLKTGAIRWQQKKPVPVVPAEKQDKKPADNRAKGKAKGKGQEKEKKPAGPQFDFRWSLAPLRPVADQGRVYVRRLTEQQSEMICLEAAGGKPLWSGEAVNSAVSDALLIGQDLFTITARQPLGGQLDVALAGFDPGSGQMQSQAPLADFRDYCNRALHCRAVAAENKVVASVGGTVICCELPGRVRWLRRQIFAPPPPTPSPNDLKVALRWYQQMHNPPLLVGDRVYVTQPGVWAVECLNLDNGRLNWRQPLPEITALAGRIEDRLVVGTTDGVLALDAQTGKILWRRDIPDRLDPILCGPPGGILCMRLETLSDAKAPRRPVLVWLAPDTGEVVTECVLDPPAVGATLCGSILVHGERQWAIFTVPDKPAERDIVELVALKDTSK
jgi:outer membrane protein assembly factor BamB